MCRAWVGSSWPRQSQGWEAEPGAGAGGHVGAHSDAFAQRACATMLAPARVVTAQGVLDVTMLLGAGAVPTVLCLVGTVPVLALPSVAMLGMERLWCGRSYSSRKL